MSRAFHIKNNYTAGTSALSTLVTKQATFVCKYLLAFDHWQTKSNPRNNTESEIAKRELIRLNQTQDFDKLSADLASAGPNSNEEEKELYQFWDILLGNLSTFHKKRILAQQNVKPKIKGKFGSMTYGIKYALYEMRNHVALKPMRKYWQHGHENSKFSWEALESENEDEELQTGVMHVEPESNGGSMQWSMYVPESYKKTEQYPLILALHGGGGRGDDNLLSWLDTAKCNKCFVVSPKSLARTWGLQSNEQATQDTVFLLWILYQVNEVYSIDPTRIYITGMSDGGTFSYILMQQDLLKPIFAAAGMAAAFPIPSMMGASDLTRFAGTPIHHVHGTTDWMFDIDQVRVADENSKKVLKDDWKFTEVVDWTHASPKKINREVLFPWFMKKRSSFNGDIKGILTQMAPGILGEEE